MISHLEAQKAKAEETLMRNSTQKSVFDLECHERGQEDREGVVDTLAT